MNGFSRLLQDIACLLNSLVNRCPQAESQKPTGMALLQTQSEGFGRDHVRNSSHHTLVH